MAPKRRRGPRALPTLPADVVFEILSWLPASPLNRFRCVCTSWHAMISDPAFLAVHTSRAEPLLLAVRTTISTTSLEIMDTDGYVAPLLDLGGRWKFRASVGNLVLLTSRAHINFPTVRVIDLATGETVHISFLRQSMVPNHAWFGFGRAAQSGTFKVICIVLPRVRLPQDHGTCEILTLGDGAGSGWRQIELPRGKLRYSYDCNDGVAVNGVLHFLSKLQDDILCFDLEREEWAAVIRVPSAGTKSPWDKIGLAELNGAMCVTHTKEYSVDIWLLNDDLSNKDVWVKAYMISVNRDLPIVPLRVMRSGGKLLFYYRRDYMNGLAAVLHVYDPCSGKCTAVGKAPTNIVGRISLCNNIGKLCAQP